MVRFHCLGVTVEAFVLLANTALVLVGAVVVCGAAVKFLLWMLVRNSLKIAPAPKAAEAPECRRNNES